MRLTEVIQFGDPRAKDHQIKETIAAKIPDLARKGTFKVVMHAIIPPNANMLTARFVIAIKHKITVEVRFKAKHVIGGHHDRLKAFLVHGSQMLQQIGFRVLVALAVTFNLKTWSVDVKLAYLQAEEPMQRRMYIGDPVVELDLEEDMALQLIKSLCGLSGSGDIWYKTLDTHNKEDLELVPEKIYPVLFLCFNSSKRLIGMNRSCVDDILHAGNSKLK